MPLSVATRNWLYLAAAALVCFVAVGGDVFMALGALVPPATPAWIGQWWTKRCGQPRRVWHHWTVILALIGLVARLLAAFR
jgi:hypothetical protein